MTRVKKVVSNIRSHRTNSTLDATADTSSSLSSSINRPSQQIPAPFSPKIPVNGNRELYRFQLYRANFSESYAQNTNHYLTQRQFPGTTIRPASFPRLEPLSIVIDRDNDSSPLPPLYTSVLAFLWKTRARDGDVTRRLGRGDDEKDGSRGSKRDA